MSSTDTIEGVQLTLNELIKLALPARQIKLDYRHHAASHLAGQFVSVFRGRGIDFEEVRPYQAGDDIRTMDWKVTARTGKPYTKLYREDRERPVYLVVDMSQAMQFGTRVAFKSVVAARAAALIGWAAIQQRDRVGGIIYNGSDYQEFRPRSGSQALLPLLQSMVKFTQTTPENNQSSEHSLFAALQRVRHVIKPGSLACIFSDFSTLDYEAERKLYQLSRHNDMLALQIYDILERTPPPPNRYGISDGEDVITLDTRNKKLCQAYQAYFHDHSDHLAMILNQFKIPVIQLATHQDITKRLTKGLNHGHKAK